MYYSRSIQYQGSLMVNICDEELIGSRIKDGNLEVEISRDYFHERIGEEDAIALLRSCSIANLVGKRIVAKALEMRLASPHSIRYIAGVPFLMLFKFMHTY
ncbi:MAG: DUF424 family protein [Candidatus Nitrosocaldus sp.]